MEELTYRHLYRVDRAQLGNFRLSSAACRYDREDDLASNGLCGLAAFAAALFKVIESQQRGFAHGHEKHHSEPRTKAIDLIQESENYPVTIKIVDPTR